MIQMLNAMLKKMQMLKWQKIYSSSGDADAQQNVFQL